MFPTQGTLGSIGFSRASLHVSFLLGVRGLGRRL